MPGALKFPKVLHVLREDILREGQESIETPGREKMPDTREQS